MENNGKNFAKTLRIKRFEIQKNVHLVMREMLRYFDVYLLAGSFITKVITFQLLEWSTKIPPFIVGIIYFFEFFFMFTRVAMEYHRKKKQQFIFTEVSRLRTHYTTIIYIGIVSAHLFSDFSFYSAAWAAFNAVLYFLSNNLLASAALTIHTKDVEFTEKYVGMRKQIVLNEKPQPKIIEVKKQSYQGQTETEQFTKSQDNSKTLGEEQLRKKAQNILYRIKVYSNGGHQDQVQNKKAELMELLEEYETTYPEITQVYWEKLEELS